MLYFSKLKLATIYLIIILCSFFTFSNFININENLFFSKKVNLGLDLQGGSYLLLEVDSKPIINQRLQSKLINLRKNLKEQNIKYQNLKIKGDEINFFIKDEDIEKFDIFFTDKKNLVNNYLNQYRSYEMDHFISNNVVSIKYSKFGLIEIKNSSLDQSLEIVRRRIDEVGTKDPTIIKRGSERILIELPGLDDPNRIKKLLGKTANLTFRLVSESDSDFGSEILLFEDGERDLKISKRVVVSGDHLINANPSLDNRTNENIVSFSLDRAGAKKFAKVTLDNVGKN